MEYPIAFPNAAIALMSMGSLSGQTYVYIPITRAGMGELDSTGWSVIRFDLRDNTFATINTTLSGRKVILGW